MKENRMSILVSDVCFGNAKFNLCRITKTSEQNKDTKDTDLSSIFHTHLDYECHLILSGAAVFTVGVEKSGNENTSEHAVRCGELFIIPPRLGHYPFIEKDGCKDIVFSLSLERTDGEDGFYEYFSKALGASSCRPITLDKKLFENIILFCNQTEGNTVRDICRRKATAYNVIASLFDQINCTEAMPAEKKLKKSERDRNITLEYLINEYGTPISVIAKNLGYTTRHTSRLIRQLYGKSLSDVRRENMLVSAKELIKSSPETSLSAIARKSGFADASAMRSAFVKSEGMTPTEYRRSYLAYSSEEK